MPTVINDMTVEPKASPPPAKEGKQQEAKSGPEMEREIEKVHRRNHERELRMWAH
jgi:hypothetical protein